MVTAWLRTLVLVLCSAMILAQPVVVRAQEDELRAAALESIRRAQRYLASIQQADGSWEYPGHPVGATALVVMSLLYSGQTPDELAVRRGLDYLRTSPIPDSTYDVSLVAMALSLSGDDQFKGRLQTLANWLVNAQHKAGASGSGAWGYHGHDEGHWDNSNTQFAILGLREAVHAGAAVPREVWERSRQHFLTNISGSVDGKSGITFPYTDGSGDARGSLQVAGIASLMICESMLDDDRNVRNGEIDCCAPVDDKVHQTIEAAFRWLGNNFSVKDNPGDSSHSAWYLYYMYGLERAGRFTGRRFLGPPESPKDWYRMGVRWLVGVQNLAQGSWTDPSNGETPAIGTAMALMFVAKGNSPVLINKLKWGDPRGELYGRGWNRQPRDASNLTDYISTRPRWPHLMSWQVVDLSVATREQDGAALLQAKVQLITGDGPLDLITDDEVALLREYINQGGFLLGVNTCGGDQFDAGFRALIKRMFPDEDYQLKKLPDTHDVYRSESVLNPTAAGEALELWGVDFGCRTAIMYAPFDHCCRWNKWMLVDPPKRELNIKTQIKRSMDLGTNIIAYATGRELLDALSEPPRLAMDDNTQRRGRLEIARLRHNGGWDTAPSALRHLQLALSAVGVETTPDAPNLAATDPLLADYPLLYMHGRKNFALSEAEVTALKNYLDQGGFLFADACCGEKPFDDSFRALVRALYNRDLEAIPLDHPLLHSDLGHDIREVRRRLPIAGGAGGALQAEYRLGPPLLEGIADSRGRYVVVYSKYDLSCALQQQATVNCAGYASDDAARIATNIVLYALSQ
ncbi:MAG: DUF4159 domain-containing protein [Planctomycetaceae bacterium]